ncbi:MAG TPA: DUF1080 domain-containing protein [Bryobacteraceae bacterium]|nr:DUF1080 domain-containing protein [Bryobacteraceae bacterium]
MTRRQAIGLCAAAAVVGAQDPGEISLFDGNSLAGWSVQEGSATAFYVDRGHIVIHPGSGFPAWLRYNRRFENFDFRCEVFVEGWSNGGIYISAPEHGRPTWTGMKINLFHKQDSAMRPESVGAIFPVVPPRKIAVKNQGQWNTLRIRLDWPRLQVWMNEELIQDVACDAVPALKHRLRSGYIGIESLGYPLRFRALRILELPAKEQWQPLYEDTKDLASNWTVMGPKGKWEALGPVLRADGDGYLATKGSFRDFEFQCYIRGSKHHNGGVIFRGGIASDSHYEVQLHDVEGAVYPTGSLYGYQRATYPRIGPEQWFPFQLIVQGKICVVRINGDTVLEYNQMERTEASPIMLQAHQAGKWIEYKQVKVKAL